MENWGSLNVRLNGAFKSSIPFGDSLAYITKWNVSMKSGGYSSCANQENVSL